MFRGRGIRLLSSEAMQGDSSDRIPKGLLTSIRPARKKLAGEKHSSLFWLSARDGEKEIILFSIGGRLVASHRKSKVRFNIFGWTNRSFWLTPNWLRVSRIATIFSLVITIKVLYLTFHLKFPLNDLQNCNFIGSDAEFNVRWQGCCDTSSFSWKVNGKEVIVNRALDCS